MECGAVCSPATTSLDIQGISASRALLCSLLVYLLSEFQHEQSASHLFFAHKTKMMTTITVAVSALHEFVQLFGKLEGPCIVVILMENACVALKELFGA